MIKVTVKCENCGNEVEVKSVTEGKVAYFSQELQDNDFNVWDAEIDVDLSQDGATDEDDVDTELKEIRIDCQKCGEYIVLEF